MTIANLAYVFGRDPRKPSPPEQLCRAVLILSLSFVALVPVLGLSPREWAAGIAIGLTLLAIQHVMSR